MHSGINCFTVSDYRPPIRFLEKRGSPKRLQSSADALQTFSLSAAIITVWQFKSVSTDNAIQSVVAT